MTQRYIVKVVTPDGKEATETHQADCWQSAVLSHSLVGAEFEGLIDIADFDARSEELGYDIELDLAP